MLRGERGSLVAACAWAEGSSVGKGSRGRRGGRSLGRAVPRRSGAAFGASRRGHRAPRAPLGIPGVARRGPLLAACGGWAVGSRARPRPRASCAAPLAARSVPPASAPKGRLRGHGGGFRWLAALAMAGPRGFGCVRRRWELAAERGDRTGTMRGRVLGSRLNGSGWSPQRGRAQPNLLPNSS